MAENQLYNYFVDALKREAYGRWYGRQNVLASEAGISQGFFSQILAGKRNAGLDTQTRLAAACGYDLIDFIASSKPKNVSESEMDKNAIIDLAVKLGALEERCKTVMEAVEVLTKEVSELKKAKTVGRGNVSAKPAKTKIAT